jgi:hypothetical protein
MVFNPSLVYYRISLYYIYSHFNSNFNGGYKMNKWKSVEKELPEIGKQVLTYNDNGICQDERDLVIGFIDDDDGKWYTPWTDIELTPTHWMELPRSPEEQ